MVCREITMIVRCIVFSSILLVLNAPIRFILCELTQNECQSIVGSRFDACTAAGYNYTLPFPKNLTDAVLEEAGIIVNHILSETKNCSQNLVGETIHCAFLIPKCLQGKRELPCKRVCGEFLKQCEKTLPQYGFDFLITSCHVLPEGNVSSGNCFEPPNFKTNDSESGPLDRGCQEMIFPACKSLNVYNHTFISVEHQKDMYLWYYKKNYTADNAETDFPEYEKHLIMKFPECEENIKKLFCGELAPPCFPSEGPGLRMVCRWVCEDIAKNCPEFFSDHFMDAEYCSQLPEGNSGSGFCKVRELPPAFSWFRWIELFVEDERFHTRSQNSPRSKAWVIIVAVLVPLVVVGLLLAVLFWLKWRRVTMVGYEKHTDEDDASPLET